MKKITALLLALIMVLSLAACGKQSSILGTWVTEGIIIDGTNFTREEMETLEEDDYLNVTLVIKEGGKAYISDGDDGEIVDWEDTDFGLEIDEYKCKIENGKLYLYDDFYEYTVCFKKTSNSQSIAIDNSEPTPAPAVKQIETDELKIPSEIDHEPTSMKASPDKYTWYVKDYIGKNIASLGYTSLGGDRLDEYGAGRLELIFVTYDGSYIDIENDDDLKNYVVVSQNIEPNTEIKLTFQKKEDGTEFNNLIDWQSIEEIVLCVESIGSSNKNELEITTTLPSPDKYTYYIKDYLGRNLASCGYTSLGGDRRGEYGSGSVKFVLIPDDGSYIDPEDIETLKNYVVTGQNYPPNTELKLEYSKKSDGTEYNNLISSQNIDEIELYVSKLV